MILRILVLTLLLAAQPASAQLFDKLPKLPFGKKKDATEETTKARSDAAATAAQTPDADDETSVTDSTTAESGAPDGTEPPKLLSIKELKNGYKELLETNKELRARSVEIRKLLGQGVGELTTAINAQNQVYVALNVGLESLMERKDLDAIQQQEFVSKTMANADLEDDSVSIPELHQAVLLADENAAASKEALYELLEQHDALYEAAMSNHEEFCAFLARGDASLTVIENKYRVANAIDEASAEQINKMVSELKTKAAAQMILFTGLKLALVYGQEKLTEKLSSGGGIMVGAIGAKLQQAAFASLDQKFEETRLDIVYLENFSTEAEEIMATIAEMSPVVVTRNTDIAETIQKMESTIEQELKQGKAADEQIYAFFLELDEEKKKAIEADLILQLMAEDEAPADDVESAES
ncbi:hypothetical protein [Actomonas aquatica]|uniref:Uncharacterized protein n=1 Tax=Actomonas aquatica TaxID=2866162 RepID=A0ABZ1C4L3_9BACT|nr:hypothetical protein [Opitutus sp. WL0086]WRQ86667.1 hypothetical protein K1X11_017785 [Opitutus sp. WL0086]